MIIRTLFVILVCAIGSNAGAASGWAKPQLPPALGFLAMQCDQRDFCFAIAWSDRKLQLVNISPGGGPMGHSEFRRLAAAVAKTDPSGQEVFLACISAGNDSILGTGKPCPQPPTKLPVPGA